MTVANPGPAYRIVSLVPSLTELLIELGLAPYLVGRTGFCIHPRDAVRPIPKVGGTKSVNLAKIRRLQPTHVIVNVDENEKPTVDALRAFVPEVIVTHPCAPQDNLELFSRVAELFGAVRGVAARAAALTDQLQCELDALAAHRWPERRVLYCIWRDPWMTVARDTYISRLLAQVRWCTLPDIQGGPTGAARYPRFALDDPWLREVELVLLSSEPYRFDASDVAAAQQRLPQAEVRLVDGELLSWYGSRAVAGLRYLQQLARADGAGPRQSFSQHR